ncbi:uncharacterized protein JCM6883_002971 [Sporobolomyces salmoneus]|uniref:uncharacterized protein n=1 Tax=Sporobolomyces salmoneus TaxID=183962 RepID=UPI00317FC845
MTGKTGFKPPVRNDIGPSRKSGYEKKRTNPSGLGRAIVNRRAKAAQIAADPTLHTSEIAAGLSSVTQENDLNEFLSTAQLADTDFSAERQNIKVVSDPSLSAASHNPYLLTPQEENEVRRKQRDNVERLQVPRRPGWTREMSRVNLERQERDAFLEWRRGLADLQENQSLLLTPFERNLEVWRQLWRTCERSDLIVQIVDARNPLNFRSEDLERYVLELNEGNGGEEKPDDQDEKEEEEEEKPKPRRRNLLLINKSDLLTQKQREGWADYFEQHSIQYAFFSAANGIALQEERARQEELSALNDIPEESDSDEEEEEEEGGEDFLISGMKIPKSGNKLKAALAEDKKAPGGIVSPSSSGIKVTSRDDESDSEEEDSDEEGDDEVDELTKKIRRGAGISVPGSDEADRTRILSVLELEALFLSHAPEVSLSRTGEKMVVGLVGYPNVGKSSTINALIGEKKVSVSATPGKTKHLQTLRLSPEVLLCDCPGLVFPQFAATKADLVVDGVLPIDQLREFTAPVELVTRRIPQEVLEGMYGLKINTLPISEGGTGIPTAREFLNTYSLGRGFFTGGHAGNTDVSRAARVILKDYVSGKLLFVQPPPGISADVFNAETRDLETLRAQNRLKKKMAPTTRVSQKSDYYVPPSSGGAGVENAMNGTRQSYRADALDQQFFAKEQGKVNLVGVKKMKEATGDKLHKKKKREKKRSGRGYD